MGIEWGAVAGYGLVTIEYPAEHAEHSSFFTTRATSAWRRGDDAVSEARERQGLENDTAWAGEPDEKQSFAAEQCGLHARHGPNVVINGWLERDQAPGVDVQPFSRGEVHRVAACLTRAGTRGRHR